MDEQQNEQAGAQLSPGAAKRAEVREVREATKKQRESSRSEKQEAREPVRSERTSAREERLAEKEDMQNIRQARRYSDRSARKELRQMRRAGHRPAPAAAAQADSAPVNPEAEPQTEAAGGIRGLFKRIAGQ